MPVCPRLRPVTVQKGLYVLTPGRKAEVVWSDVLILKRMSCHLIKGWGQVVNVETLYRGVIL